MMTVSLPSGAIVMIETNRGSVPIAGGVSEAADTRDRMVAAWDDVINVVAELSEQAVAPLRKATGSAKEVTIEFGVSISGKTGIILVEGTTSANLKITLKW